MHHPVVALGIKEWHSIKRDPREWMMLLPLLVLLVYPVINAVTNPEGFRTLLSDSRLQVLAGRKKQCGCCEPFL
ncbi:hypothetical protein [Caldalkalibacillus uzonensis]|uniref:hypothetical protein n=1 Tax=Caldalkalibacillus uzonensis TaxID=353224 RepID=UPI0027D89725|nr:hypothetical protein [Caldalkalibacillus uzonensis]